MAWERKVPHRFGGTWCYSLFSKVSELSHKTSVDRSMKNLPIAFPTSTSNDFANISLTLSFFQDYILFPIAVLRDNGSLATNLTKSPPLASFIVLSHTWKTTIIPVSRQRSIMFGLLEFAYFWFGTCTKSSFVCVCMRNSHILFPTAILYLSGGTSSNLPISPSLPSFLVCFISYKENNYNSKFEAEKHCVGLWEAAPTPVPLK